MCLDLDDYDKIEYDGTGSHDNLCTYKFIIYPFDKYEIKIKLTSNNEFIGITEVKINKNFLSYREKQALKGHHDVEEFYKE